MTRYFISDLHLDPAQPKALAFFLQFLQLKQTNMTSLSILGDFFEVWIGDDAITPWHQPIIRALSEITRKGIPVYFMPGNRDFFIGKNFLQQTGMTFLHDPYFCEIDGTPTLLMHGDLLCTDDRGYQHFRRFIRKKWIKTCFLSLPLSFRSRLANGARQKSQQITRKMDAQLMDINQDTVHRYVTQFNVKRLIHGHTHRPTIENMQTKSLHRYQRIVLGDWHQRASILSIAKNAEPKLDFFSFEP